MQSSHGGAASKRHGVRKCRVCLNEQWGQVAHVWDKLSTGLRKQPGEVVSGSHSGALCQIWTAPKPCANKGMKVPAVSRSLAAFQMSSCMLRAQSSRELGPVRKRNATWSQEVVAWQLNGLGGPSPNECSTLRFRTGSLRAPSVGRQAYRSCFQLSIPSLTRALAA